MLDYKDSYSYAVAFFLALAAVWLDMLALRIALCIGTISFIIWPTLHKRKAMTLPMTLLAVCAVGIPMAIAWQLLFFGLPWKAHPTTKHPPPGTVAQAVSPSNSTASVPAQLGTAGESGAPPDVIDGFPHAQAGRFPGGGGQAGKFGQFGGTGGAGLIKMTYAPAFVPEPPKTFFDLYQREAYSGGYASRENFEVAVAGAPTPTIEVTLSWNHDCQPKTLWLFIRGTNVTAETLYAFLPRYQDRLKKLDVQARAGITAPCNAKVTPREGYVPISPTMYAYHESPISPAQTAALVRNYRRKNLKLILRGPDYFVKRQRNWKLEDSQKISENSPHIIYIPGDL